MKNKNPDFIFECNKCGHNMYVDKTIKSVEKVINYECDECGEEAPVFTLIGEGNYDKTYGKKS